MTNQIEKTKVAIKKLESISIHLDEIINRIKRVIKPYGKPMDEKALLNKLYLMAVEKAESLGYTETDMNFCGFEKSWETCLQVYDDMALFYFNIGHNTHAILYEF